MTIAIYHLYQEVMKRPNSNHMTQSDHGTSASADLERPSEYERTLRFVLLSCHLVVYRPRVTRKVSVILFKMKPLDLSAVYRLLSCLLRARVVYTTRRYGGLYSIGPVYIRSGAYTIMYSNYRTYLVSKYSPMRYDDQPSITRCSFGSSTFRYIVASRVLLAAHPTLAIASICLATVKTLPDRLAITLTRKSVGILACMTYPRLSHTLGQLQYRRIRWINPKRRIGTLPTASSSMSVAPDSRMVSRPILTTYIPSLYANRGYFTTVTSFWRYIRKTPWTWGVFSNQSMYQPTSSLH